MQRPHGTHAHSVVSTAPTDTVESSLLVHAHSSPLFLAARLHRCCTNRFHYINNNWTFSGCTMYMLKYLIYCPEVYTNKVSRHLLVFAIKHQFPFIYLNAVGVSWGTSFPLLYSWWCCNTMCLEFFFSKKCTKLSQSATLHRCFESYKNLFKIIKENKTT